VRFCDAGECPTECEADTKQCYLLIPQTCAPSGQWSDGDACAGSCVEGVCDAPIPGTWTGTTSQGLPIEFDVDASGTHVTRVEYGWSAESCGLSGSPADSVNLSISADSFSQTAGSCPSAELSGQFDAPDAASGSLTLTFSGGGSCACTASEDVTWTATAP
jgi:hypothetical protein